VFALEIFNEIIFEDKPVFVGDTETFLLNGVELPCPDRYEHFLSCLRGSEQSIKLYFVFVVGA